MRFTLRRISPAVLLLFVLVFGAALPEARATDMEVGMSNKEFEQLETFEAHVLGKADKVFSKGDHKRAAAEYDSFILEFPRSSAIPYALMRKGRSLQQDDKRYEAVREFTQVMDYFPNAVKYAAAAQTYKGWSYWESGDEQKALTAWAKVAADKDYAKQPIAAGGLLKLADHHRKEGRFDKAIDYYKTIAVNFRKSSDDVARKAIEHTVYHYIKRDPDEPALRAFYKSVGTFHHRPRSVEPSVEGLLEDGNYWTYVRRYIDRWGRFNEDQAKQRKEFYRYWVDKMDGRFAGWDDYQIDLAGYKLQVEGDQSKWMQRLDEQFERKFEEGDFGRIISWIDLYRGFEDKWKSYYNKLNLGKMDNGSLMRLIEVLYRRVHADSMGENAFAHINWDEMREKDLDRLRRLFWHESEKLYLLTCQRYPSAERGKFLMLEYHHARRNDGGRHVEDGLKLADELVGSETYAGRAIWMKAELLFAGGKWQEAIGAYQQANNPPANLKGIVECYLKMGKPERAISTLREVENFFKKDASWAAYEIAKILNSMGKRDAYIAELRGIMKKYPGSRQFSDAHRQLERMGIKIGGYVDSDK